MTIQAHRQQRHLVLEGNIGAGKSTFLKIVQNRLSVQVVFEPHEKWQNVGQGENLLEKFYKDTPRWAYTFQSYAFITRILEQEAHAQINQFPLQVLERSVFSDRYCFAKNCYELGFMTSLEWKIYQEWFNWLVDRQMQKPHGFIYLYTDPDICYERLCKRNRSEESGVSREYLHLLHDKHQAWLIEKKGIAPYLQDVPVLLLPCNKEFETDRAEQDSHMAAITEFCKVQFGITVDDNKQVCNESFSKIGHISL